MPILSMSRKVVAECTSNGASKPELHGGESGERHGILRWGRRFEQPLEGASADQAQLLEAALRQEALERGALILEEGPPHIAGELGLVGALADHRRQGRAQRPAEHALALREGKA